MARRKWALLLAGGLALAALAPRALADNEALKAFKEGKRHFQLRDYPQALAAWERTLKLDPHDIAAQANIAKLYVSMGRFRDALVAYDKALAMRSPRVVQGNIWNDKGRCFRQLKSHTKALEAFNKSLELGFGEYSLYINLGNAYCDLGRSEEAIAAWEKALELKPDLFDVAEAIEDEKLKLTREVRPFRSSVPEIEASRARSAALDLAGALEALGENDRAADPWKGEVEEIEARRAYLAALGAAVAPGTPIVALEAGKPTKVKAASGTGIEVEGESAPIEWRFLPRGSLVTLVAATDRSVKAPPLGSLLVLYELGLWPQADQHAKAWIDADPASATRAFQIVARYRGLAEAPRGGFLWKGSEWLTPDEDDARTKDLVTVEGKAIPREEARKLAETQRRDRKVAKRSQVQEAKARAEKLSKERGVTDVRTILSSGDPLKRADVVVVADGFTSAELPTFERLADTVAKTILTIEPFKNYARYVNVHRVTVVAEQSGILGSRLGAKVGQNKTISCDREKALDYGRFAPDADLVVVCENVKDVRATGGGGVITMDVSGEFDDVVLHEMGHAFAGLDDEYADSTSVELFPDYNAADERRHVNTTRESNAKKAKWHYWLLPPALAEAEKIGCFEGGWFREKGYFRPAKDCRMRSRGTKKYCPVCLEQLEKTFYSRIEPIDDVNIRMPDVTLYKDEATKLEATAIAIAAGEKLGGFTARWFVDDRPALPAAVKSAGVKTELSLKDLKLAPGVHEAVLRVDLKDGRVRRDGGLLSSVRAWRVSVADAPRPKIGAPERVTATRGELVTFDVTLDGGTADQRLDVEGPGGSTFVTAADRNGRFVWCPPRNARGLFHVSIQIGEGETAIRRSTEILLQDPARNVPPVLRDQGLILATRGQPLVLRLEAFDADGDGLVFSSKKLPPGATLNPGRGVLRWVPSYSTPFDAESEVVVHVTDGVAEDEVAFKIRVDNRPIDDAGPGFDVLQATRSTSVEVRKKAVAELLGSDLPRGGKLLELARLLRDPEPEVAKKACEELSDALEVSEKSARGLVAIDLADHVWELADRPEVLAFLKDFLRYLFNSEAEAAAARIQKDLAAVDKYQPGSRGAIGA